jgi:hypothetical protein
MTERPTNPLLNAARVGRSLAAFVEVNGHQVPTDLDGYCAWLNERERRRGTWRIVTAGTERELMWQPEIASSEWLRERGLIPQFDRAT